MSRSSRFTFSTSESDRSNSNMVQLDTTPFNPYNFQHSTHHSSAPVLFTPVASTVTPHSDVESLVNGFDLQSYESFIVDDDDDYTWPLDPEVLGTSDTTPFSFYDGGDSVHFSNVSWSKDQLGDFQGIGDSFVTQQPGVTQGISHVFTGMPREAQWDDNAPVLGEHAVLQSVEADFDLSQIGVWNGIDEDLPIHQPGSSQSVEGSRVGCDKDIATEYSKDCDIEYETDDEYMSVSVPNGCMAQCPTPEGDWKTGEVNTTGAIKSKSKPALNKKSRNGKPARNQIGDRKKSPVKNAGIKKSGKKGFAGNKISTTVQYEAHELLNLSIPEKMRKANIIIGEQKTKASLAEKLGQYIRAVRTENRVSIEGVYWKAPQNDATIPITEAAKEQCVRQIVAAILNNGGCKEVSTTQAFLNRWGEGADHYTMEELQDAAWQTVDAMVDIHTNGWTKKILDTKLRDLMQKTMFCTFEDRFSGLVNLLTGSKRTCNDLMKFERFYTIIGNPFELEIRTSSNMRSNRTKADRLKRSREEEKGGAAPIASRLRKRARMTSA